MKKNNKILYIILAIVGALGIGIGVFYFLRRSRKKARVGAGAGSGGSPPVPSGGLNDPVSHLDAAEANLPAWRKWFSDLVNKVKTFAKGTEASVRNNWRQSLEQIRQNILKLSKQENKVPLVDGVPAWYGKWTYGEFSSPEQALAASLLWEMRGSLTKNSAEQIAKNAGIDLSDFRWGDFASTPPKTRPIRNLTQTQTQTQTQNSVNP